MHRGIGLVLYLLVIASSASSADSIRLRSEVIGPDGSVATTEEPARARRSIVELRAPRAAASGQVAGRAALLAQFRSDVERLASISAAKIDHEYSVVFFGAAIDAPPETLAALRALDYVVAIHPDRMVRAYAADDPIDARPRVNAQPLGARGAGTVVAIIDTGIDYDHPSLGGGYGPAFKVIGGYDFVNEDEDPMDDAGHGTHVAGTVAANAPDLIGVAPEAKLLAYKVLSEHGFGSSSDIIAAIERSVDPNGDGDRSDAADVINLSLGGGGTAEDPMARAVDKAVEAGIVVCVAAGNAGQTASIGTPGAAASAITVGAVDGAGVIAPFTSRGPTSRLLTFKPEIMAPGVAIISARAGGGMVSANGTSMATPHVAGVAALLRELHPEWTPARVKAAIVASAISMPGTGFARGAGRIDAVRAANASVILSEAGISFGLSHAAAGTSTQTRSIGVTNISEANETFVWVPPAFPVAGIDVAVEPARVDVAAGQTATLTVRISIDHVLSAFPDEVAIGADLKFNNVRGTSSFSIPWALLRSARATVTYDGYTSLLLAFTSKASPKPVAYGGGEFEMFVKPGSAWEFLLIGEDFEDGAVLPHAIRYLIAEKRGVDGDVAIPFTRSDASVRLTYAAQDSEGRFLRDLPEEGEARRRYTTTRLLFADGDWTFNSMVQMWGGRDIFISPASERYTLIPFEAYADAIGMRGYNVQYPAFQAPSASATLESGPSAYRHARLRWERPALPAELFVACGGGASIGTAFVFGAGACIGREVGGPIVFDYYATPETTARAFSGLIFQSGSSTTATFRGREGGIVASSEPIPPRTAPSIPHGSEATIGGGLFFPFAFFGTTAGLPVFWPSSGFFGPYGETLRNDTMPAYWEMFDASGTRVSLGKVDPQRGSVPPGGANGFRLVVRREWRHQSGLTSGGTLEVNFAGAGSDLTAPTITSLRVADPAGRPISRLAPGGSATLHFSAGDLDHGKRMEPRPTKADATRVSYRLAGTAGWIPLAITLVDSESGTTTTQGHVPAGDIYRADLSEATRVPSLVDLRVELEDLAGNRLVWTQEGALFVGPEGAAPSRARRARRE